MRFPQTEKAQIVAVRGGKFAATRGAAFEETPQLSSFHRLKGEGWGRWGGSEVAKPPRPT